MPYIVAHLMMGCSYDFDHVFGIGRTKKAALLNSRECTDPDSQGLEAIEATQALVDLVEAEGGAVEWRLVRGVADVYEGA